MTALETFDLPSLEAFTSALVAAGFEPIPETHRREWKGPAHPAFHGLTDATKMRVVLRDGWPFVFPVLFVQGLHTNHLTARGFVCLWREGDGSGDWQTLSGFFQRIEQWCEEARSGWDERGLAQDAYLNFTPKHHAVATFDINALNVGLPGTWGSFSAAIMSPFRVALKPAQTNASDLRGLWFQADALDVPPRNLAEIRALLSSTQRRGLDRDLKKRRPVEALERSGSVDLLLFCWNRATTRHLLVLALSQSGDDAEATVLQEGPIDEESLLMRAGPDAIELRDRSAVVFGLGALGGHLAVCLASSGLGRLRLVDEDQLLPGNVVRHVVGHDGVGIPKADAVRILVGQHAPWTEIDVKIDGPETPSRLRELIEGVDLVIDATGSEAATASIAAIASEIGAMLISGGLFRGGALARVQRQGAPGDVALADRGGDDRYRLIPPGLDEAELIEPAVGCSAPINNAPPASVLACAALMTHCAVDALVGRFDLPDEVTDVYRALPDDPPFDELGRVPPS